MKKNYYELLGVNATATPAEIKTAAQLLLQKHHPSKQPGDAQAEARFKQIKAIYATLADPQKRAAYDASLTKTTTGTPPPVKPAETKPATPVSVSSPSSKKASPTKENTKAIPKQESVTEAISKQDLTKNISKPENVDHDLLPGERVIYRAKVHWLIYLNPLLMILFSTYLGFVDFTLLQTYLTPLDFLQDKLAYVKIGLQILAGVGVWMLLYATYTHLTTNVRITSKRVLAKMGFSAEPNEISHPKFEHLEIKSGLLGKIFGFGTIKMRGTKGRGVGGLKIQASHIASPKTFEKKLMQAIRSGGYEG